MTEAKDYIQSIDDLLDSFLEHDALGKKTEAKQAALAIVDAVSDFDAKVAWTRRNLDRLPLNRACRIRNEIYQGIVFPALKAEFDRGDAEASYLIGKYWQNLIANSARYTQMGEPPARDFFRLAFECKPSSHRYREAYLNAVVSGLKYTFHEWPTGILIDHSNLQDELLQLKEEFDLVQSQDKDRKFAADLVEWIEATKQYERRLAKRQ